MMEVRAVSRTSQHPPRRRDFGRRAFLRLTAASAAALGLQPLLGGTGPVHASARRVLLEDLTLGPGDLARGEFEQVTPAASGIEVAPGRLRGRYVSPVLTAARQFT